VSNPDTWIAAIVASSIVWAGAFYTEWSSAKRNHEILELALTDSTKDEVAIKHALDKETLDKLCIKLRAEGHTYIANWLQTNDPDE
jgi:hypothetical protein